MESIKPDEESVKPKEAMIAQIGKEHSPFGKNRGEPKAKSSFLFRSNFYGDHLASRPTLPYNYFFFHFQAQIY